MIQHIIATELVALFMLVSSLAHAENADAAKQVAAASQKLVGVWIIESVTSPKGDKMDGFKGQKLTFAADGTYTIEYQLMGGTQKLDGSWKLVAVKDGVLHMDQVPGKGQVRLAGYLDGKPLPAILRFDDDHTLRERVQVPGTIKGKPVRPADFTSDLREKGVFCLVKVYKCEKP
jgi:hypothetical protein